MKGTITKDTTGIFLMVHKYALITLKFTHFLFVVIAKKKLKPKCLWADKFVDSIKSHFPEEKCQKNVISFIKIVKSVKKC